MFRQSVCFSWYEVCHLLCGKRESYSCRWPVQTNVSVSMTFSISVCVHFCHFAAVIGPILWGHSGPLCHALSSSSSLSWTSMRACDSSNTSWMGVRRLAVANEPNIFQMLLVTYISGTAVSWTKLDQETQVERPTTAPPGHAGTVTKDKCFGGTPPRRLCKSSSIC